jgi:hypothetical protein
MLCMFHRELVCILLQFFLIRINTVFQLNFIMLLAIMPGTPMEWYKKMINFKAQKTRYCNRVDPVSILYLFSMFCY